MQTKFLGAETIAEGTMLFKFEKPAGFTYKSGQSIDLILIDPSETDAEGNSRAFSLVSTPADEYLAIATRMRDTAFKRVLKNLASGTEVNLEGPFGDMTLHENEKRSAVLLAGGIGITPFYSMAVDAAARKLPHKIVLMFSNRRPEDTAFLDDLTRLHEQNSNFTFVGTMTDMESSVQEWKGERGYINADMLKKYVDQTSMPIYYIAGPAGMVAALRKVLTENGVSNDDIRAEEFTGY
mgnify:CR=1 FL=1